MPAILPWHIGVDSPGAFCSEGIGSVVAGQGSLSLVPLVATTIQDQLARASVWRPAAPLAWSLCARWSACRSARAQWAAARRACVSLPRSLSYCNVFALRRVLNGRSSIIGRRGLCGSDSSRERSLALQRRGGEGQEVGKGKWGSHHCGATSSQQRLSDVAVTCSSRVLSNLSDLLLAILNMRAVAAVAAHSYRVSEGTPPCPSWLRRNDRNDQADAPLVYT